MQERPQAPTNQILALVREFVRREVAPQAAAHDRDDTYPHEIVEGMTELGLFGIAVPEEYGGLGLDHTTLRDDFRGTLQGLDEHYRRVGHPLYSDLRAGPFRYYGAEAPVASPHGQRRNSGAPWP